MSSNRMFQLFAQTQLKEEACFNFFMEDPARLWHCRYGRSSKLQWTENSSTKGNGERAALS